MTTSVVLWTDDWCSGSANNGPVQRPGIIVLNELLASTAWYKPSFMH